jgi:hypothetical protein
VARLAAEKGKGLRTGAIDEGEDGARRVRHRGKGALQRGANFAGGGELIPAASS